MIYRLYQFLGSIIKMVVWPIRGLISLSLILQLRLSTDPDQTTLVRKLSKINHPIASRTLARMLRENIPHIKGSILAEPVTGCSAKLFVYSPVKFLTSRD
jgi:hypothetical protein